MRFTQPALRALCALVFVVSGLLSVNSAMGSPIAAGLPAGVGAWSPVSIAAFNLMFQDGRRQEIPAVADGRSGGESAGGFCQVDSSGMGCTNPCPVPPGLNCVPVEITVYPDGTWQVTKCDCVDPIDGCYIAYDPVAGPLCQGVCPDGTPSCEIVCRRNLDNSVTYRCACAGVGAPTCEVISICNPDMPGTCRPGCGGHCPTGQCCTPTVIKKLPTLPPQWVIEECDCLGATDCHPILDIDVVVCVGVCPDGTPCERVETYDPVTGIYYYSCDCNQVQTGACCYEIQPGSIQCVITTAADCAAIYMGIYMGNNVPCTPNPCDLDGACCVGVCPTTTCIVTTYGHCAALGGLWQGIGTTCPARCDRPTGACCYVGAAGPTCVIVSAECCNTVYNGSYFGDNTTCAGQPCYVDGACCIQVGGVSQCIQTTQAGCLAQGDRKSVV